MTDVASLVKNSLTSLEFPVGNSPMAFPVEQETAAAVVHHFLGKLFFIRKDTEQQK